MDTTFRTRHHCKTCRSMATFVAMGWGLLGPYSGCSSCLCGAYSGLLITAAVDVRAQQNRLWDFKGASKEMEQQGSSPVQAMTCVGPWTCLCRPLYIGGLDSTARAALLLLLLLYVWL